MSLIAEALKKAQQGATRRLPPFSLRRPLSGLPGWRETSGRRLVLLAGAVGAVGVLLIGGLYLTWPRRAEVKAPAQPLLVAEPAPAGGAPTPAARAPAQPQTPSAPAIPNPEQGTSIPEVRAALEAEPQQKSRQLAQGEPARSPRRVDPRREVALGRVKEALQEEAKPGDRASQEPLPPPLSPPRAAEPPSPIVEVHTDGGKEAAKFFTEALRSQQRGEFARSIEEYEKSIAVDPRNPAAFNNLGVALKESGRLDLAIEAFEKALALDPKYEKALNNLGVIRYRKGQYEDAIDLFKQALRINPTNVESYTNLGLIYLLAERHDDALGAFQQALRHDPKLAEAHYNLGVLWERRGHRENAERHYQKFVELASERHAPLVAKVRDRLQFLARGR